jgi:hypothetical protein
MQNQDVFCSYTVVNKKFNLTLKPETDGCWPIVAIPFYPALVIRQFCSCEDFAIFFFWGGGDFISNYIQHCFTCRPSDSTVPTDAGIEPRTVATGALAFCNVYSLN